MKFLIFGINILISVLTASCLQNEPSKLEFKEGRKPSSTTSVEKKLWLVNCASCHTNSQNGLPTKLYASVDDINAGIANVDNMKELARLTVDEIGSISRYLNEEARVEAQNKKNNLKVKSKVVLSTRSFVMSKLKTIYVSSNNSSNDLTITGIINFIGSYPGAFGGTCVTDHELCVGEAAENYSALMNMQANVTRDGLRIKVCREIHNHPSSILNALNYSGLSETSDPTNANFKKLIESYLPGSETDGDELVKELRSTFDRAIGKGMTRKDAWNMSAYILCSTPISEKI